eukprot:m.104663 g.104663  ORF g.104663 m.104663 type:complete len:289 (+) comp12641_c1_seq3:60-926(+)
MDFRYTVILLIAVTTENSETFTLCMFRCICSVAPKVCLCVCLQAASLLAGHKGTACLRPGEVLVVDFDITTWLLPTAFKIVCSVSGEAAVGEFVLETAVRDQQGSTHTSGHTKQSLLRTPFRPLACVCSGTATVNSGTCELVDGVLRSRVDVFEERHANDLCTLSECVNEQRSERDELNTTRTTVCERVSENINKCPIPTFDKCARLYSANTQQIKSTELTDSSSLYYIPQRAATDEHRWVSAIIALSAEQRKIAQGSRTFRIRSLEEKETLYICCFDVFSGCKFSVT